MYRRRQSGSGITLVVILGILFGMGYMVVDHWRRPAPLPMGRFVPTPQPTPTLVPEVAMSIPEVAREITANAMFFAPTAGIRTRIVQSYLNGQSWDVDNLGTNAGHLQGTAWVDEPGNVVLAGHAEAFSGDLGIFSAIDALKVGDPLIITQDGQQYLYNVVEARYVAPDDLTPFYPTNRPRLTLTTCSNYDFLQNSYQERFVVIAELA